MHSIAVILALSLTTVFRNILGSGHQSDGGKIVGGSLAAAGDYPFAAALLYTPNFVHHFFLCGGTIISNTAVLSAAHCFWGDLASQWSGRVGSTLSSSGGDLYYFSSIIQHPAYNSANLDNDIAVLRTATIIIYNENVASAPIAGSSYILADNTAVTAIGWGSTVSGSIASEELRTVQVWTVNQDTCVRRYHEIGDDVTGAMLCAGVLDEGGRDTCNGDSGGPLLHGDVVVGVTSKGEGCGLAYFPGIYARVSVFADWIVSVTS